MINFNDVKNIMRENACMMDKDTFYTSIQFADFPQKLLNAYSDMIKSSDITDGGYLSCEYWIDDNCYVYNFNFEDDSVSVNEYFNKPLWNDIVNALYLKTVNV